MSDARQICFNLLVWALKRFGPAALRWAIRKVLRRARKGKAPSKPGAAARANRRLHRRR